MKSRHQITSQKQKASRKTHHADVIRESVSLVSALELDGGLRLAGRRLGHAFGAEDLLLAEIRHLQAFNVHSALDPQQ